MGNDANEGFLSSLLHGNSPAVVTLSDFTNLIQIILFRIQLEVTKIGMLEIFMSLQRRGDAETIFEHSEIY